jgi:hypothetical protein
MKIQHLTAAGAVAILAAGCGAGTSGGSAGPIYSADQVFAALTSAEIPHHTNPSVAGDDQPSQCDSFAPDEAHHVRQGDRAQLQVDTNPDDDADVFVMSMDNAIGAQTEAAYRRDQTGRFSWPAFVHGNLYVEIQMPVKQLPRSLVSGVRTAINGISTAASPTPPLLACSGRGSSGASSNGTTATSGVPAPTVPTGPQTAFGDGNWVVGTQVAAGTYHTNGGEGCYWEREKDLTGGSDSTLANDNVTGPAIVTVLPTDAGFKTSSCGRWSPLAGSGPQTSSFDQGYWAVGIDIAPGTYSTDGGDGCYWERMSDFTGSPDSTLANDNPDGPTTVTIAPTDKGFKTSSCSTWTKVG